MGNPQHTDNKLSFKFTSIGLYNNWPDTLLTCLYRTGFSPQFTTKETEAQWAGLNAESLEAKLGLGGPGPAVDSQELSVFSSQYC